MQLFPLLLFVKHIGLYHKLEAEKKSVHVESHLPETKLYCGIELLSASFTSK